MPILGCGVEGDSKATEVNAGMPLEAYLAQPFVNGVPYEGTIAYGQAAVPDLIAVLNDPQHADSWSVAATMLGMIAEANAVSAVIRFIERQEPTFFGDGRFRWAQSNALLSLGYAANQGRSRDALRYLLESLKADIWVARGVVGAEGDAALAIEGSLDADLTHQALLGLALSGTIEAKRALERYRDDATQPDGLRETASNALVEHKKIVVQGLIEYDRRRWEG